MSRTAASVDPLVARYLLASRSANTRRAYKADLLHFGAWGGALPSTPDEVARYLACFAGKLRASTLLRHLSAIASAHRDLEVADPTKSPLVARVVQGIRRTHGTKPQQVEPLMIEDVGRIVSSLGMTPRERRDRAILLLGFFGALRRSEIVALDFDALTITERLVKIAVRRSKTDQMAAGRVVVLAARDDALCPVRALSEYIRDSIGREGPLFFDVRRGAGSRRRTSVRTVARVVKRLAARIGFDPRRFGGHSLRAGFATSAALCGFDVPAIARQTGHRTMQALSAYVRTAEGGMLPLVDLSRDRPRPPTGRLNARSISQISHRLADH
jgi:integrase